MIDTNIHLPCFVIFSKIMKMIAIEITAAYKNK